MQKVDSIIAENPGVSLDELEANKKINADQKLSAQRKPALQAELSALQEQEVQFKKVDDYYQQQMAAEKELVQAGHKEEVEKLKEALKVEAAAETQKASKQRLLTLSRFLRAAAARRASEDDADSDLSKAFEGALLLVYGGDATAVNAIEKLIDGTNDSVQSTEGVTLSVTCTFCH